jgi:flagellar protein FlbD
MIKVTKLNNMEIFLNPELIETVESTPDTLITLNDGKKILVREKPDYIVKQFTAYQQQVRQALPEPKLGVS